MYLLYFCVFLLYVAALPLNLQTLSNETDYIWFYVSFYICVCAADKQYMQSRQHNWHVLPLYIYHTCSSGSKIFPWSKDEEIIIHIHTVYPVVFWQVLHWIQNNDTKDTTLPWHYTTNCKCDLFLYGWSSLTDFCKIL